ncbi:MAG TPA: hypothetical protein VM735_11350 [Candidatus Kapabacteria bacterium]|nr:hypothetical protein [Candidatus Kapabacteria bacterium]
MRHRQEQPRTSWVVNSTALVIAVALCGAVLAFDYHAKSEALVKQREIVTASLMEKESQFNESLSRMRASHEAQLAETTKVHEDAMKNPELISGAIAKDRRSAEWRRRLWHEPEFAQSPMERALLKMEALGRDSSVSTKEALSEVATLAAPPGSRVEVSPFANSHRVRVAFRMSAVSESEQGAITKHKSPGAMRAEVQEISANIMRALFEFCGTRGIDSVTLSCNHAMRKVRANLPKTERQKQMDTGPVTMGVLFTVRLDGSRAAGVHNWREISTAGIVKLLQVEYDGFNTLVITQGMDAEPADPDVPLEF